MILPQLPHPDVARWFERHLGVQAACPTSWELIGVPAVTPFPFGVDVSKVREGMMLEDPETAMERLSQEMNRRLQEAAMR